MENKMIKHMSGTEFRESGGLWLANIILHTFGMAITWDSHTDELKAARVKYRGFSESYNDIGYRKITEYMINNAEELLEECEKEEEE